MISAKESATRFSEYKEIIEQRRAEGKKQENVTLLCATKTVSAQRINEVRALTGLTHIGENRVQELLEKYDALEKDGLEIHFIGKLQSNKVKGIAV